ncbi:hypothetical protein N4264_17190 [Tahibacter amnicola]|uniref:Inner membrane protein n=1 Tax=Tahibacter amnicola TaxID=2976241 RepID=A0ABY6BQL0_9GAMM|nr:hypothetical protein [Tahibacter amnicola]UXI70705.1 hypothetical protein N4264_17190 [Tahibacter amnicola]
MRADPLAQPPGKAWQLGAVVWPSFFAAGVATTVFFAIVDPILLGQITWPQLAISREAGYTLGFFMFWACTFSACSFTRFLLAPPTRKNSSAKQ